MIKIILAACILSIVTADCAEGQFCMACSATTTDKCDACFNWATGFIQARSLNANVTPNDCKGIMGLTVQECQYYSGLDTNVAVARTVNTCDICK
jgi:hypothetical protein